MDGSSEHLKIINSVLSLAYNLESYPNHLYKAGYEISRVEPRFIVNGTLEPDILFMNEERALICECKSGEYFVSPNVRRYPEISARHLTEKGIDISSENIEFDVGIFGKSNIDNLTKRLAKEGIKFPQVIIDDYLHKKYGNDFKDNELQKLFKKQIKLSGKPMNILKFTKDSSFKVIAPYIFNSLMARTITKQNKFTARELAQDALDKIWANLDNTFQTSLSNKVRRFLRYGKNHELGLYLSNRDEIWTITINEHWKSRNKFSKDCRFLINGLDQTTLWDFLPNQDDN